ncbi:helix-turn-helix domain-containing protein [Paenibacillus sp. FSL H3-0333]|uniref:helix-turn-helix domain-containing protein n=1 Tax=Paenibacillus sp. FSL H3-0333 TaxID=2921373 RepID=UPI0030FB4C03
MSMENYPPLLSVKQVQEILQLGENNTYKLFKQSGINLIKIGKHLRISKVDLARYLSNELVS